MFVYHDFIDCKIQVHTCIVKFYLKKKTTENTSSQEPVSRIRTYLPS